MVRPAVCFLIAAIAAGVFVMARPKVAPVAASTTLIEKYPRILQRVAFWKEYSPFEHNPRSAEEMKTKDIIDVLKSRRLWSPTIVGGRLAIPLLATVEGKKTILHGHRRGKALGMLSDLLAKGGSDADGLDKIVDAQGVPILENGVECEVITQDLTTLQALELLNDNKDAGHIEWSLAAQYRYFTALCDMGLDPKVVSTEYLGYKSENHQTFNNLRKLPLDIQQRWSDGYNPSKNVHKIPAAKIQEAATLVTQYRSQFPGRTDFPEALNAWRAANIESTPIVPARPTQKYVLENFLLPLASNADALEVRQLAAALIGYRIVGANSEPCSDMPTINGILAAIKSRYLATAKIVAPVAVAPVAVAPVAVAPVAVAPVAVETLAAARTTDKKGAKARK